jgi:predicted AAA+ superfamily ATPase
MWIKRDFEAFLANLEPHEVHPIKVLKGPRQVGKTSLLEHLSRAQIVLFDDFETRQQAQENPRRFLERFSGPLILDEATLVPSLFPELKRLVDEERRQAKKNEHAQKKINIWITGSNQTLLERSVQESLAGRASYFDLNTLSIHELGRLNLSTLMLRGGWPELHTNTQISPVRYLNDLISTFIEKDIVAAAGIERKAAFTKTLGLVAGRIGKLVNASDIAKNAGVETTTVQSWIAKLEQNALIYTIPPYFNNLNQRLIKTPKIYFQDVGLASRFQGWTEYAPLSQSSTFGHLVENLACIEILRFFQNSGLAPEVFFIRSKEKVEVDFLIKLANNRWLAVEVKNAPINFTIQQLKLLDQVKLNIIERWVVSPEADPRRVSNCRSISFDSIHDELKTLF